MLLAVVSLACKIPAGDKRRGGKRKLGAEEVLKPVKYDSTNFLPLFSTLHPAPLPNISANTLAGILNIRLGVKLVV